MTEKATVASEVTKAATCKDKGTITYTATFVVTSSAGEEPTVEYKASSDVADKTVVIPPSVTIDGVTYRITEIADNAFANNKTLEKIVISDNIKTIGDNAFNGCSSLKKIVIPDCVTEIGGGHSVDVRSLRL